MVVGRGPRLRFAAAALAGLLAANPLNAQVRQGANPDVERLRSSFGADTIGVGLSAESLYVSNVGRTPDPVDSVVFVPRISGFLRKDGANWLIEAQGVAERFEYAEPQFRDLLLAASDSQASLWFPGRSLRWNIFHRGGPVAASAAAPNNPETTELISNTLAGPEWTLTIGRGGRLKLGAQYGHFEVIDLDRSSRRTVGTIDYWQAVGRGTDLGFRGDLVRSVTIDGEEPDLERRSGIVRINRSVSRRGRLYAAFGFARSGFSGGRDRLETISSLYLDRELSTGLRLRASHVRSTILIRAGLLGLENESTDNLPLVLERLTVDNDLVALNEQALDLVYTSGRLRTTVTALRRRRENVNFRTNSSLRSSASLGFDLRMSRRNFFGVGFGLGERELPGVSREDEFDFAWASYRHVKPGGFSYRAELGWQDQSSTAELFNYDNFGARIVLIYGDEDARRILPRETGSIFDLH